MQKENVKRDNRILIDFWDQAFTLPEEQKAQLRNQQEDWLSEKQKGMNHE